MNDLHDLLSRRYGLQNLLAQGALLHSTQEVTRDLEVHVSFEEDASDLTQTCACVLSAGTDATDATRAAALLLGFAVLLRRRRR